MFYCMFYFTCDRSLSKGGWNTLPNCSKYERTSSMVVDADKPPTNSFLVLVTIWTQAHNLNLTTYVRKNIKHIKNAFRLPLRQP